MQLKKKKPNLKKSLMVATCGLLGTSIQAKDFILNDWDVNTALMNYAETNRVNATEGLILGNKTFSDGDKLSLKFVFDTLTGASANGAVAQPTAQTFTTSSGRISTATAANEVPLDHNFKDTRGQGSATWTQTLNRTTTLDLGGYFSAESDYMSVGANSNMAFDFNQKNTTLSFGVASSFDQINPHGGIHQAFTEQPLPTLISGEDEGGGSGGHGSKHKNTIDGLAGITQVINENTLIQLNYSYSKSNGYLTDPYDLISIVDAGGITQQNLYENRPGSRTKQALYLQVKGTFFNSVLDVSARYMKDDWSIRSKTLDVHYRIDTDNNEFFEPHFRYYHQTAANFYQPFLNQGEPLPTYASADYRLGDMDTYTFGLRYGKKISAHHDFSFRVEYYHQKVNNPGFAMPGILTTEPVFQGVNAIITQISYSF